MYFDYFGIDWGEGDSENETIWHIYIDGKYVGETKILGFVEKPKSLNINAYLDEYNDYIILYKMFGDLKYKIYADSLKIRAYGG